MVYKPFQTVAFFVFLLALFIVVLLVVKPFLPILAVSVILAILIEPLQRRILRIFSSRTAASLLAVLIVMLFVSLILILAGRLLAFEISGVYDRVQSGDLVINRDQIVQSIPAPVRDQVQNLSQNFNSLISRISNDAFNSLSSVASNVAAFVAGLIIIIISTFYLLRDGPVIKETIVELSPMASKQEDVLIKAIVNSVKGVIKGSFLTAICHGLVAIIGFAIFGVPSPFIWAFFVLILGLIPTIGAPIGMGSAVIYFLITGHFSQAVGLGIWAVFSIGLIDNVIGPNIVGSRVRIHPLFVMMGVLGGALFFGPLGFLIGPILMAIFVATIEIYRTDFKDYFFR